jgi:hypothetical protein
MHLAGGLARVMEVGENIVESSAAAEVVKFGGHVEQLQ